MKKSIYSFLTLVLCSQFGYSQITIDQNDMPNSGTTVLYELTTSLQSEDFSLTGSNYTWDYSAALMSTYDTLDIVGVTSTPFAYQLYFNNAFLYPDHKADYAVVGMDISTPNVGLPGVPQVTIDERYDYYKVNSTSLQVTGFGANINGVPTSVKYDTIDQIYPLPMTFGTNDSTAAYYIINIPTLGTYGQWIRRKVECDGYGSLTTPAGIYSDVLRIKTTLYQEDTLFVSQFSFGTKVNRPTETIYQWRDKANKVPIMEVVMRAGTVNSVKYLSGSGIGIAEEEVNPFIILPTANPYEFNISGAPFSDINNVVVYDIKGEIIASEFNQTLKINTPSTGIYIISITMKSGENYTQKVSCTK